MAPRRNNRSLRTDIVAGFATLVVALGIVGGYALYRQARAVVALRLQEQGYLPLVLAVSDVNNNQNTMDTYLDALLTVPDIAAWREWIQRTLQTRRAHIEHARVLARGARDDAETHDDQALLVQTDATLADVEHAYRDDEREFGALFAAIAHNDAARARAIHGPLYAREQATEDSLRQLNLDVKARMRSLASAVEHDEPRTLRVLSIVSVCAMLMGLVTLLSGYRALRPLALLIDRVRAVAGGDLSPRFVPARADEIGELAREFDNMVDAVKARDQSLRDKADEIRRAEQHLEQVVATLRAAVMVVSRDGVVTSANPAARALADGVELLAASFAETPFGRVEPIAKAVTEAWADGAPGAALLAVPMGERALDVSVTAFTAPGGLGSGALLVADDVTEREQARARLLQNERLAAIGRMAAHVTHEVRNPLSSMALNAEMLADEVREPRGDGREIQRLVRAIQQEIDRLTAITEEYLRVARLPRPRLEREDLVAVVQETVQLVAPEYARAKIELGMTAADDLPTTLLDEAQIRQALLNLLRNAREAVESRPEGQRSIRIRVHTERSGIAIALTDSGPGIRADVRAHLFELFFTTKERGSGLGLPLTREIVRAHGGDIEVTGATQDEGGGAKFVIWLPIASARESAPSHGGTRDAA